VDRIIDIIGLHNGVSMKPYETAYWAARREELEIAYREYVRAYAAVNAAGAGDAEIAAVQAAIKAYAAAWKATQE